jgi:acyl transferase domain-containing protein/acyl carrier protein
MSVGTRPNGSRRDMSASREEPLAIVGIGCRFPGGADGPDRFWDLLASGVDAITEVPRDRWDADLAYNPETNRPGKTSSRWGGFIAGIDRFDAGFFGITPREAAQMDPQQRMLLEVGYEAIEDAGEQLERLSGEFVGVFVGIASHDYADLRAQDRYVPDAYSNSGGALSIAANRLSYVFNLRGPSLAVDTACSSGLVAVHLAAQSLWHGECRLAMVGGVNCILTPEPTIGFSRANMLSARGRCRAFDAGADGYVRAEGAGVVILKPLSHARADGNSIYALIRGTGTNQDGRTQGLSLPSEDAQETLLRHTYTRLGIDPDQVAYIEAHGTGTPAGDPIEARAIGRVLGQTRAATAHLPIGSVKTNIGHLEAASGIAGLIKAALVLRHGKLVPNLHFSAPSPDIPFDELKLRVPRTLEDLPESGASIVGINSFGFGGANAHAVLERAPQAVTPPLRVPEAPSERRSHLLAISARSPEALVALADSYREFAGRHSADPGLLRNLTAAAAHRRSHHPHRLALAARTPDELEEGLGGYLAGETRPTLSTGTVATRPPRLGFVFAGMGPQWWGMGRQLLLHEPIFRDTVEHCDSLFRELATWSIVEELGRDASHSLISEAEVAQPCNFALQLGLLALWDSWGVRPDAIVGHSAGEVAAAYAAKILSLEDAVTVIYQRSRLQQRATGKGRMLAVGQPVGALGPILEPWADRVSVAAVNSPEGVTLSGDAEAIEAIEKALTERHVFARFLDVRVPYHSHHMEPLREELLDGLAGLDPQTAVVPYYSVVEGRRIDGPDVGAPYWWRNVRDPVRFADAIGNMLDDGIETFVELSPNPVLNRSIRESAQDREAEAEVVVSLRRDGADRTSLLAALGRLYTLGVPLDWDVIAPRTQTSLELPNYPWQRDAFWVESEQSSLQRLARPPHPLLHRSVGSATSTWETDLDLAALSYLKDHVVRGEITFPAAAYVEMACAAVAANGQTGPIELEDVEFNRLLAIKEGQPCFIQIAVDRDGRFSISSRSRLGQAWASNVRGVARASSTARPARRAVSPERFRARAMCTLPGAACYEMLAALGLDYGPDFRGVSELSLSSGEALGRISVPAAVVAEQGRYRLHPAFLDACFHTLVGIAFTERRPTGGPFVPTVISRLRVHAPLHGENAWSFARLTRYGGGVLEGDFVIFDDDGRVLVEIGGFRCQQLPEPRADDESIRDSLYTPLWIAKSLASRPREAHTTCSPPTVAERVARPSLLDQLFDRRKHYAVVDPRTDRVCTAYVLQALRRLGWRPRAGQTFTAAGLAERLGVSRDHLGLFGRLLEFLAEDDLLRDERGSWRVVTTPPRVHPETELAALERELPDYRPVLSLFGRCAGHLDQVLRGRLDPLELVFPEGSTGELADFYEASPYLAVYNRLLRDAMAAVADTLPAGRHLRVLEIGAGTGGSTAEILPVLPSQATEYVFTDVSSFFLPAARKKFADFPFIDYRTLDIESDPVAQGFEPHSFDVIIAADVVHATRDLTETLTNIRSLLAANGMLVMLEVARGARLTEMIFGLLKGWWRFSDRELRPANPWVDGETWRRLLDGLGFTDVSAVTDAGPWRSDHAVYLARGPRLAFPAPAEPALHESGGWLIFRDQSGTADAFVRRARSAGQRCVLVNPSTQYARVGVDDFHIRPGHARDFTSVLGALAEEGFAYRGIVHAWALDAVEADVAAIDDLRATDQRVSLTLTRLVQALARVRSADAARLYVVTRNAQPVGDAKPDAAQSSVWGLARVLMNEHSSLRCTVVDLRGPPGLETEQALFEELVADAPDQEVVLHGQARYVSRVVPRNGARHVAHPTTGLARSFRLDVARKGLLDSLVLRPVAARRLAPSDVEIEIAAAGLNFRDVMKALGLYPSDDDLPFWLGDECSGVVRRVGRDVTEFSPGDRVIAIGQGCFGSRVTTSADHVARMPAGLTFEEAAAIPIVWLTTYYALNHLARLAAGERILIHTAAGGVGLAAVQLAQLAGAEIFATAGSRRKREYLRSLGVRHVFDSRSLDFAERIRVLTKGEGIDVVLNSLAGDYISTSMSLLRPAGRFVELGKVDLYQDTRVGLWPFRNGLSFTALDMGWLMQRQPALCKSLLQQIVGMFESGQVTPLPATVFPLSDAVGAFRHMAQAKHIGKIVLDTRDVVPPPAERRAPSLFRHDASYLITGGAGGFGLAVAEWLVDRGAKSLVLAGRSGLGSPHAELGVTRLRRRGARVEVVACDVAREADVSELFGTIDAMMPPLRGVFHAAMVLDDALSLQLNDRRFYRVVEPKAYGAWNLHRHTRSRQLDHFVLFSSLASIVGNIGQANYAAANAFLDGLAGYRRALGLPGLTVNWGPIAEVGFVARNPEVARQLERMGFIGYRPSEALALLEEFLTDGDTQTAAIRIDFQTFTGSFGSESVNRRFSHILGLLAPEGPALGAAARGSSMLRPLAGATGHSGADRAALLDQSVPEGERLEMLTDLLKRQFAAVTGMGRERLDSKQPITSYGLDSLMRLEFVLGIEQQFGVRLDDDALSEGTSFASLATELLREFAAETDGAAALGHEDRQVRALQRETIQLEGP